MDHLERSSVMGTQPILKLILHFSLPSIVGLLVNSLYNIVDRIFVGHAVGPDGLGAITVVFPAAVLVASLGSLAGVGSASQVARSLGMGLHDRAQKALGNSLTMGAIVAVPLALTGWFAMDWIIALCGGIAAQAAQARIYFSIVLWGLIIQLFTNILNYQIRAEGQPRYAMWTMILGALANVALDWLFINRMAMGVAGAAWGTVAAQLLSFAWVLAFYLRRRGTLRLTWKSMIPDWKILWETLTVGLSPFVTGITFSVVMVVFNQLLGSLGGELAIASIGIFFSLDSLLFLPVQGIGEGVLPLVGYNYGAGRIARVRETARISIRFAVGYFLITLAMAELIPYQMVHLFNTDNPELIEMTVRALRLGYWGMPLSGIAIPAGFVFQGLGKARLALYLSLGRQLFYVVPLWILPPLLGTDGVWLSFPCIEIVGGAIAAVLLWKESRRWKTLEGQQARENQKARPEPSRALEG